MNIDRHMYYKKHKKKNGHVLLNNSWCGGWFWYLLDPVRTSLSCWLLPYFCGVSFVGIQSFLLSEYLIAHFEKNGISVFSWGAKDRMSLSWLRSRGAVCVADDPKFAMTCEEFK